MIKILEVAHHRNGIAGGPFYVVRFKNDDQTMVGIVFEASGHVAVLDIDLLHQGVIAFSENSWRGDEFEPCLRRAIERYDKGETPPRARDENVDAMLNEMLAPDTPSRAR